MDMYSTEQLEKRRLALQEELDAGKSQAERNRMGQFATPPGLAAAILRYAKEHMDQDGTVSFIDPAIGTGSFYSALLEVFPRNRVKGAVGFEIDLHYGRPAARLWKGTDLKVRIEDFTQAVPPPVPQRSNLLICNPPYVRHHHIVSGDKERLRARAREVCGVKMNGLAGLYCYFLCLSHAWMRNGGLAGWLIPSEFMDVNYGIPLKHYLLDTVNLLHIHRFDPSDVQFGDALVSSAVVWFRKEVSKPRHNVRFTYGGSLERPTIERHVQVETLRRDPKWTRYPMRESFHPPDTPVLSDFFRIKRGLVTGNNKFFILTAEEVDRRKLPSQALRPILPSPRYLPQDEVEEDSDGNLVLDRHLFLLDCALAEEEIRAEYPTLWQYLEEGRSRGINEGYICKHRRPWYTQENRPPAPFVCTYLGRTNRKTGRPFRFILNNSQATAANVYLMLYPKNPLRQLLNERPDLKRQIWQLLNEISPKVMLDEGRVYGGGLHKLEPKELGNVPARPIAKLIGSMARTSLQKQTELFQALPLKGQ